MFKKPKRFTVVTGKGRSSISSLNAVDKAMIDASIGELNLIKVSSVLPEGIEKKDEIHAEVGELVPAVLSESTGEDEEIAAGVAWGFRKDKKGGYVMEMSSSSESIDLGEFENELENRLNDMGDSRDVDLVEVGSRCEKMVVGEDESGCVIAGLVFLP